MIRWSVQARLCQAISSPSARGCWRSKVGEKRVGRKARSVRPVQAEPNRSSKLRPVGVSDETTRSSARVRMSVHRWRAQAAAHSSTKNDRRPAVGHRLLFVLCCHLHSETIELSCHSSLCHSRSFKISALSILSLVCRRTCDHLRDHRLRADVWEGPCTSQGSCFECCRTACCRAALT